MFFIMFLRSVKEKEEVIINALKEVVVHYNNVFNLFHV
jgi:hypothetical protein